MGSCADKRATTLLRCQEMPRDALSVITFVLDDSWKCSMASAVQSNPEAALHRPPFGCSDLRAFSTVCRGLPRVLPTWRRDGEP